MPERSGAKHFGPTWPYENQTVHPPLMLVDQDRGHELGDVGPQEKIYHRVAGPWASTHP